MNKTNSAEDISVRELLGIIWQGKLLVCVITVALAAAAAVASKLLPKKYDATAIVSPVADDSNGSRLSSLVSQVGGLSSLSGIAGLPSAGNTQKSETVAVLQSEALTESYIRDNDLLPVLYPKLWDPDRRKWKEKNPADVPTVWKANVLFKKKIRGVATDTKTGLVTITIRWQDPILAAKWANDLIRLTNDYLRKKTIDEAQRNIAYLSEQAAKTDVVGVKEAIYSILQNEIKKMMLASGSQEYALKVLDPAVPAERPSSPQPVTWVLMASIGGLFFSVLVVLVRHWWRHSG